MTKNEMMNEMAKSFGLENEHVINFFRWCENNPNASYIDVIEEYNNNTCKAVKEILENAIPI